MQILINLYLLVIFFHIILLLYLNSFIFFDLRDILGLINRLFKLNILFKF